MSRQYWVIDTETEGQHSRSRTTIGPFATIGAAEQFLRDDAASTFLHADKSIRDSVAEGGEWAKPMLIVEVVKVVRQVPSVKVTVRLEQANIKLRNLGATEAPTKEKTS